MILVIFFGIILFLAALSLYNSADIVTPPPNVSTVVDEIEPSALISEKRTPSSIVDSQSEHFTYGPLYYSDNDLNKHYNRVQF